MSPLDDSKTVELGGNTEKSAYKLPRIVVVLVIVVIASLVLTIGFSIIQLVYGSPAFGIATTALLGLLGAVSVAFLNGAYFEPKRAQEEREYQRKRDSLEQQRKENEERKRFEEQKEHLRKGLYSEIVSVYCRVEGYYNQVKKYDPAANYLPKSVAFLRNLADFSLYDSTLKNSQLLFWQLPDARVIDLFYRTISDHFKVWLEVDTVYTAEYVGKVLEWALLSSAYNIADDIDISLLRECSGRLKQCMDTFEKRLKDPEKLLQELNKMALIKLHIANQQAIEASESTAHNA